MPALGPLDRRTLRTRCVACTRRKIKCQGGLPCLYCSKKKLECLPQDAAPATAVIFVNTSVASKFSSGGCATSQEVAIQRSPTVGSYGRMPIVPLDQSTMFIGHFFSEFLPVNSFGGPLDLDTVITHFQTSPSLYQACSAVGALDLSNKYGQSTAKEHRIARLGALNAYRESIISLRNKVSAPTAVEQGDGILWTTLFLGLFELMYDKTGEGFVSHFLYGTSKIIQFRGPLAHLTGNGRSFFLIARVFEISRALIYSDYSEPTFLCQPEWRQLTKRIAEESDFWHPKETLFDLMIDCSALSDRVGNALKDDMSSSPFAWNGVLENLATEGNILRSALNDWHADFQRWLASEGWAFEYSQSLLAKLYFHGISIFLSGIFDYRSEFNSIPAPRLFQNEVEFHVDSILSLTKKALDTMNLGGVLFFFPLRVAGARVTSRQEANAIITMLNEISKRSFVVAGAFVSDLRAVWLNKGL